MDSRQSKPDREPLVSVLVCTYDAGKFIEATLRSVADQTYRNLEILVLDNGSSDRTVEIVNGLAEKDGRIQLHAGLENLGAYGGLNYLLERAGGRYVAIQDHDDLWHRDKIQAQIECLENHGDYLGCGTAIVNHYEKYDLFLRRRQAREATIAWHTSLLFRNGAERYDLSVKVGTDFHFMQHVLCRGKKRIRNLEEPYVLRRIHADGRNLSSSWINAGNARDILRARIGWFDKLCLINRLLLPDRLVDRAVLGFFLRHSLMTRQMMRADETWKEFFSGAP